LGAASVLDEDLAGEIRDGPLSLPRQIFSSAKIGTSSQLRFIIAVTCYDHLSFFLARTVRHLVSIAVRTLLLVKYTVAFGPSR
jgi:hypothetical protein